MTIALRSKHPGGRPSKYRRELAPIAHALCCRGATDHDLAQAFDVTTVTIWRWRTKHEEFCNAVKAGKDAFDDRVERSLAQRAFGYSGEGVPFSGPDNARHDRRAPAPRSWRREVLAVQPPTG